MRDRRKKTAYLLRTSVAALLTASVCACGILAVSSAYFEEGETRADRRQAYLTARSVADAAAAQLGDFEGELSQQLYGLDAGERLELGAVEGLTPEMGDCTLRLVRETGGAAIEATATVDGEIALCRAELSVELLDLSGGPLDGVAEISLGEVLSPLDGFAAQADVRIGTGERTVSLIGTERLPLSLLETLYSGAPLSVQAERGSVIRGGIVATRDVELSGALTVGDGERGITTSGKVVIRGGVTVKGDVSAQEIVLEGDGTLRVEGTLNAQRISLSGGSVTGRVTAESLEVGEGGSVTSEELLVQRLSLNGNGALSTGTAGTLRAESIELKDRATLAAGANCLTDSFSCAGESVLTGTVETKESSFGDAACMTGTLRTENFSFAPDWTGTVEGTLICAQPFEGLSREQLPEETEGTTAPSEENEETNAEKEPALPEERQESEDQLAGDGPLRSDRVKGTITLEPGLVLPEVTVTPPEREPVLLPLLREPALPDSELLPSSVCETIGTREQETVGSEDGDSYYRVCGDELSELVVRGTGNVYLYLCEGSELTLSSVRYEMQSPASNLFLIVEQGAKLELSLPEGERFYGYLCGKEGSSVRLVTGGRSRRSIVGGVRLAETKGAEKSALSGLEVIPAAPQARQGTAETALFWSLTGYTSPDDRTFLEVSVDE